MTFVIHIVNSPICTQRSKTFMSLLFKNIINVIIQFPPGKLLVNLKSICAIAISIPIARVVSI